MFMYHYLLNCPLLMDLFIISIFLYYKHFYVSYPLKDDILF